MPTARHRRASIFGKFLIASAIAFILFIALIVWAAWSAATAKPMGMVTDYAAEMQRVVAEAQPPGTDVWDDILFATDLMRTIRTEAKAAIEADPNIESVDDYFQLDFAAITDESWQADLDSEHPTDKRIAEQARLGAIIARRALDDAEATDLFSTLDTIAAGPRAVRPINVQGPLINLLLPELRDARDIGRLSAARAHLAAQAGDDDQAVRSIEHGLAIARHFRVQATLIDHLVGLAIQAVIIQSIDVWLTSDHPPSADTLAALAAAMDRQHSTHTVADAIKSESIWAVDMIQWTHTPGGRPIPTAFATNVGANPGGFAGSLTAAPPAVANLAGFIMPSARETQRILTDIYDAFAIHAATPRADRGDIDAEFDRLLSKNWLAEVLVPAISKASDSGDLAHIHWNLTRTAIAIQLHRARTGALPTSLADLTDPNAPSFTKDPVTKAAPLHYRPNPHPDANPTTPPDFVLYSIALDCADDNAAPTPDPRRPEPGDIVWGIDASDESSAAARSK